MQDHLNACHMAKCWGTEDASKRLKTQHSAGLIRVTSDAVTCVHVHLFDRMLGLIGCMGSGKTHGICLLESFVVPNTNIPACIARVST